MFTTKDNKIARKSRFNAFLLLLGKKIANSYFPVENDETTKLILRNIAKIPNSSDEYNLVNTGVNKNGNN